MSYGFRFFLLDTDRVPIDPAVFVTAAPNWTVGETVILGSGEQYRIVSIDDEQPDEAQAAGFNGTFVVEPL